MGTLPEIPSPISGFEQENISRMAHKTVCTQCTVGGFRPCPLAISQKFLVTKAAMPDQLIIQM